MELPEMRYKGAGYTVQTVRFRGLNLRPGAADGELVAAENLSAAQQPFLTQRTARTAMDAYRAPTAVFGWDKLVVVDGTDLYYDGKKYGVVTAGEKQFCVVGSKLIIWPDKKFLDLQSKQFGDLAAEVSVVPGTSAAFTANSITMESTFATEKSDHWHYAQVGVYGSGEKIKRYDSVSWTESGGWVLTGEKEVAVDTFGSFRPTELKEHLKVGDKVMLRETGVQGSYLLNTCSYNVAYPSGQVTYGTYGENSKTGFYGVVTESTSEVNGDGNVYFFVQHVTIRVQNAQYDGRNLADLFSPGDKVQLTGCTTIPANNTKDNAFLTVQSATRTAVTFKESTLTAGAETGAVKLSRPVPDLDFICEKDNRLWGVSNKQVGKVWNAATGKFDETTSRVIMASALGNPMNFWTFEGVDTDSYQVAVASKGDFTALVNYSTSLIAMKENQMFKVFGDYPSNYQMYDYDVPGCAAGCHGSAVILGEVLYYAGRNGVYAYTGDVPSVISEGLGDAPFTKAVAGTDGVRYLLAAERQGARSVFVFDPRCGYWMREDEAALLGFALVDGTCYMTDGARVMRVDDMASERVSWYAEFAPADEATLRRKRYQWIGGRILLGHGASATLSYAADADGWVTGAVFETEGTHTFRVPLAPMRCDRLRIKLEGVGPFQLEALQRAFRVGSEL